MRGKLGEHEVNMGERMKNDFVHSTLFIVHDYLL